MNPMAAPQPAMFNAMGGAPGGEDTIAAILTCLAGQMILPEPEIQYAVYVANLPPDTTNADLLKMFAPFGAIPPKGVKALLAPDGTCKGIGFVNFCFEEGCQAACNALN